MQKVLGDRRDWRKKRHLDDLCMWKFMRSSTEMVAMTVKRVQLLKVEQQDTMMSQESKIFGS